MEIGDNSKEIDASAMTPDENNENIKNSEGEAISGGLLDQVKRTLRNLKRTAEEKNIDEMAGVLFFLAGAGSVMISAGAWASPENINCATAIGQQVGDALIGAIKSISLETVAAWGTTSTVVGTALMDYARTRHHQKETDKLEGKIADLENKLKSNNDEAGDIKNPAVAGSGSEGIENKSSI